MFYITCTTMQAKILILLSYLCLHMTGVVSQEGTGENWRAKWSHIYKEEDTIQHIWENSGELEGDILTDRQPGEDELEISGRNIAKNKLWPYGVVPYVFNDAQYNETEKQIIRNAMDYLETIIRRFKYNKPYKNFCRLGFFNKKDHDTNYVFIRKLADFKCSSHVGMQTGRQVLNLSNGCLDKSSVILHELLHTLGFAHQHSAHNRDQYISIVEQNVRNGSLHNFQKKDGNDYTSYGLDYDFDSIMHYSPFVFAKLDEDGDPFGPTLVSLVDGKIVKSNTELSVGDRQKLKHMYCS